MSRDHHLLQYYAPCWRSSRSAAMPGRVRLSVVGAAGTLPSKCSKCTVDAVVLVEPRHATLARAAINKLRLKVKDVERVKLVLKSAVREHAVGTVLPCGEADLSSYLATDCVVAVSVMEAPRPAPLPAAPPPQAVPKPKPKPKPKPNPNITLT